MFRIFKIHYLLFILLFSPAVQATDLFENIDVLQPTVGPMMGQPEAGQRRFWLKGPTLNAYDSNHYYGILQIKEDHNEWDSRNLHLFPLNVPYDSTGIKDVKDLVGMQDLALKPGTYTYRCGYVASEKADFSLLTRFRWHDKTFSFNVKDPQKDTAVLAFGSCRYFAQLFGFNFWLSNSDQIFQGMNTRKHNMDAFALIGDYIYADPLGPLFFNFSQRRTYSQFKSLYETAMTTPNFRELIATVPCFHVLDDHEITNNFGEDYPRVNPQVYQAGMAAYMTHQHMVTPAYRNTIDMNHLGYPLTIGNVAGFMINTRSNRSSNPPRIIHEDEMFALKNWLLDHKQAPYKVLFSSVPMFPIYANNPGQDEDKWYGFKDQMMELLNHINDNRIHGVILCAGDVHWSMYTQIESLQGVRITTVIASPFFSPWGHDEGPYSAIQPEKGILEFVPNFEYKHTSQVYHTDSYAELSFGKNYQLTIKLFDAQGALLNEQDKASGTIDLTPPSDLQYHWG